MAMTITELRAAVKDLREYIPALEQELGLTPTAYGLMPRSVKELMAEHKSLTAKADELEGMTPVAKATTAPAPRTTADILANATRPVGAETTPTPTPTPKASAPTPTPKPVDKDSFVLRAIVRLRKPGYKGMHAVFSGFNGAYAMRFGEESTAHTRDMQKRGLIEIIPCKGGVQLYLKAEAPKSRDNGAKAKATLDLILAD